MSKLPFNLGIHPINWVGEDVKEHGDSWTFEQIINDIEALGLKGTEMGRKFPTDLHVLKKELAARDIQLVSQWKSVFFSEPSRRTEELKAYEEHVLFLKEMGSKVISTAEIGGSLHWDPRRTANEREVARLDEAGWKNLAEGLNQAGEIAKAHGMKLTYHHHGGTVVERPEEIDRLLELTDPGLVYLLFDTGHAYYGGSDPLALLKKHYKRIAYIHLKDIRQEVLDQARAEGVDFASCIRKGVFTVPGDGCLDFQPIFAELIRNGYSGWALLEGEQDPAVHPAFEYAKRSLAFIASITAEQKEGEEV
jgi:inosose dehydratase